MPINDRKLAQRCQQGEAVAYTELVRRHRGVVRGIAYAILACSDDTDDVVQETFVRAYEAIHQYNGRYEFGAWVRRIAVNCAVGKLRNRERRGRLVRNAASATPHAPTGPAEHANRAELQARVRQAIRRLPLRQQLAITLFGLDDMNLAETADAMGCSVGTVKQHLYRARRRLAELLSDDVREE
jgi:RNA polymerase sigma-70 factor (ECF subfamily)